MINKLPEVGKRYRLCVGFNNMEKPEYIFCEVKNIFNTSIECYMQHSGITHYYIKDDFLKSWEELLNSQEKPEEKPQSIWKPVSELPTDEKLSVIVELESGEKCFSTYTKGKGFTEIDGSKIGCFYGRPYQFGFSPKEIKYCTLTDFINNIEQTKLDHEERLRKLEGKNER